MRIQEILIGRQIHLQTCTEAFASEAYVSWMNDQRVNQYIEARYTRQTMDTVKAYIKQNLVSEDMVLFAIVTQDTNKHIGNVHLTVNKNHRRCIIAYMIGETNYWGRGIATEAIKLATKWAFLNLDIARMDGALYANNIGSGKAVIKAGYRQEGIRPKYCLLDTGERVDCIEVGLLREDFERLTYEY